MHKYIYIALINDGSRPSLFYLLQLPETPLYRSAAMFGRLQRVDKLVPLDAERRYPLGCMCA